MFDQVLRDHEGKTRPGTDRPRARVLIRAALELLETHPELAAAAARVDRDVLTARFVRPDETAFGLLNGLDLPDDDALRRIFRVTAEVAIETMIDDAARDWRGFWPDQTHTPQQAQQAIVRQAKALDSYRLKDQATRLQALIDSDGSQSRDGWLARAIRDSRDFADAMIDGLAEERSWAAFGTSDYEWTYVEEELGELAQQTTAHLEAELDARRRRVATYRERYRE